MSRATPLAALLLTAPLLLAGCAGEPAEAYCEEVEAQREPLSRVADEGGPTALLDALPSFQELRAQAPRDIRDDWDVVVGRLGALDEALARAGVDPADYDRSRTGDLDEADRTAVESAARQLATPEMVRALEGVQQQARDVCGTSLTL